MEQKFMYSVRPRKPIVGLESVDFIRTARSLELTKADVLICLDKASVYRRFSDGYEEKATKFNLDRLHNEKRMTDEEFKKFKDDQLASGAQKVVDTTPVSEVNPAEVKKEEPVKVEEPVVEDVKEETKEEDSAVEGLEGVDASTADEAEEPTDSIEEGNTESESDSENSDEEKAEETEEVNEQNSPEDFNGSKNHHKKYKR